MSGNRRTELMEETNPLVKSSLGGNGAVLITDTSAITGNFRMIYTITETVFSVLTADHTTNDLLTQSVGSDYGTFPADRWIYGDITAITLTSGSVIAYK